MEKKIETKWIILGSIVLLALAGVYIFMPSPSEKMAENYIEKAIEKETGGTVDVDYSNDSVNIETQDGSFKSGENVTLPSDFPSDVYVVEGKLLSVVTTGEKNIMVSIETKKTPAEVKTLYQDEMASDGWEIAGVMDFGDTASLMGKKDTRDLSVVVSADESSDLTNVVLTVATNE